MLLTKNILFLALAVFFLSLPATSMAYSPYSCGIEGQVCLPQEESSEIDDEERPRVTVVSYGAGDRFTNLIVSGLREVPCSRIMGDPAFGTAKKCSAISYNLPVVEDWISCGTQSGGDCVNQVIAPDHVRLARYGMGGRYVYMFVSKGYACPKTIFEGVNLDPFPNIVKECSISSNDIELSPLARWKACGSVSSRQGQGAAGTDSAECVFPGTGNYLVRFYDAALGEKFRAYGHRIVTGSRFECSERATGYKIGIGAISCQYISLPHISSVEGNWQLVGSCQDCGEIEYKVTVGVERGKRSERESSWTAEVSTEVASEFFGVEASVSATFSEGGRSLLEESFAMSVGTEYTVTCDKGALWQWTTRVDNTCFAENVECEVLARARDFLCIGSGVSPSEFVSVASISNDPDFAIVDKDGRRAPRSFTDCPQCPALVEIPGGAFIMGSPIDEEGRTQWEGDQRMVSVPQFVLGMYEVTVAQWKMCVADQACAFVPAGQGDAEPVAGVGWYDAQEYIEWLSQKSGRQYRLPTEAEWEFAARAGSTTPFWTGYRVNPRDANYDTSKDYNSSNTDTPFGKVRDAGAYRPNAYGLYDVIGNVQEWVEDCFDTYAKAPTDGRPSLGASARSAPCSKAVRGGSWRSPPAAVRSAWREALFPSARISDAGFRVARDF